ncbi:MAG: SDR family NAD(P)-dependent oxidoreductase [Polyangiaceae bacterium]|nr:SDR family NAD(P)-dependent oxidoreductase [Polyangiaceae bacterium]
MGHLLGKVAIVTGAGNGIGRAVARLFAAEGAAVVVADPGTDRDGNGAEPAVARRVAEQIVDGGGRALAVAESVTSAAGAAAIVDAASTTFGRLDVLVNAAGIAGDVPLTSLDETRWQAVLEVQLQGTLRMLRAALPNLIESRGRIVNTASHAGVFGSIGQACHAVADAGVYALTRTAAIELQRYGVTANVVVPLARTRQNEGLPRLVDLDHLTPDHVAPAYLYLGSDLCRDRTGQVLVIAGGRVSVYRVEETAGRFKETAAGPWTAEEIAEYWDSIAKA